LIACCGNLSGQHTDTVPADVRSIEGCMALQGQGSCFRFNRIISRL
jgi:hypothetical protein